jgi:hypothetical protein
MDFRLIIALDPSGRIQQTAVLAENAAARAAGHRLLQVIEPEVAVFAERVHELLDRDQRTH